MKFRKILAPSIALFLSIMLTVNIYSQESAFSVKKGDMDFYKYPWAGGLNSCQFSQTDIDMDGIKDILIFDRMGDRIIPMLNSGIADSVDYFFAPEYAEYYPELHDWVIFRDYNNDGKNDIFTYSPGYAGIKVYKNISSVNPAFELVVYPYLKSFQYSGYTNILVTSADYPAIEDMDGDGDLDILTFYGLGSFVEYHKNLSVEKYGNADSLDYEKTQICWGEFAESDESNQLYLDTCFGVDRYKENASRLPHTGSTFLIHDLNGDGNKDLLLGDVDYPDLYKLINGGTSEYAHMVSFTNIFPEGSRILKLFSMPQVSYFDVNNDGVKDLVVSPFDPGIITSENYKSVWLYNNSGSDNNPEFHFVTDRFLQTDMIDLGSGAYPVLFDFTNDGLSDLLVGNYGYYDSSWYDEWLFLRSHYTSKLAAFENIGSEDLPVFQLYNRDYASLSELNTTGLIPAFADLDNDGNMDMLVGSEKGNLYYYSNVAAPGEECNFQLMDTMFQNIDVGEYSAPQFFDLDKDNLTDLIIGEKNGNLNYYRNTGNSKSIFELVTDSLGHVLVTDFNISYYGYSTPCFFYDRQGEIKLLVGSEQGLIFYFEDIEDNLTGYFQESESLYEIIDTVPMVFNEGYRSAAVIGDLNKDGVPEMIAGNYSGGLRLYSNMNYQVSPEIRENKVNDIVLNLAPNPACSEITIRIDPGDDIRYFDYNLIDINGDVVATGMVNETNKYILPLGSFPAGVYFLNANIVTSGNNAVNLYEKLIILHP